MLEEWNTGIMSKECSTQQPVGSFYFSFRFFSIFHTSIIPLFHPSIIPALTTPGLHRAIRAKEVHGASIVP